MARSLKLGFDARMVYYRQAGIGQYILNLLRELSFLQQERGDFDLTILQSRKEPRLPASWLDLPPPSGKVAMQKLWTPPHHRLEQLALPVELARSGINVLHSPDFIPPFQRFSWQAWRFAPVASVITIHDLAFLAFPHLLTAESKRYYGQIKQAAASAQAIIAVSHSTARDVITRLDVASDKVQVIYEAANSLYRPLAPPELDALATKLPDLMQKLKKADANFLLFVSTIEPRKNLPILLAAFRRMLDELRQNNEDLPKLVIAGNKGWLFEDIFKRAQELQLEAQLVWLGGVSEEELLWLYNKAALLAMPSLYEGFGLPPLEALACGTPVLVADISSLPEVVGDLGQKLPPEDVSAWAKALTATWHDRERLRVHTRQDGPKWVQQFSWRKAAEETLNIYQAALKG